MKIKLVTDSSSNLLNLSGADFSSVPLKVMVGKEEFVDDGTVDTGSMLGVLKEYKGPSSTACPNVGDWLDAFADADVILGAAITSALSGCYNAAEVAAQEYRQGNPDRKVFILDSLTTGPELALVMEKYLELIRAGETFEEICRKIRMYIQRTKLMFSLESLSNFAKNGRVSHVVAAAVGILGIRVVGRASDEGTLDPMHKVRGEKKAINCLIRCIKESGYCGGKMRITHTDNLPAASALADAFLREYPKADITIGENRALCAYYTEKGGVLIGYET